MPIRLQSRCSYPGCRDLAVGASRCAAHARETPGRAYDAGRRFNDPTLAANARFRGSARWQKFRLWFTRKNPLCCDPFGEHGNWPVPTQAVHHVLPLSTHPELGLVEENCRAVCTRCHNRIERMERAGQSTARFFAQTDGAEGQTGERVKSKNRTFSPSTR